MKLATTEVGECKEMIMNKNADGSRRHLRELTHVEMNPIKNEMLEEHRLRRKLTRVARL